MMCQSVLSTRPVLCQKMKLLTDVIRCAKFSAHVLVAIRYGLVDLLQRRMAKEGGGVLHAELRCTGISTLYTAGVISGIIVNHGCRLHLYAGDTQIYLSVPIDDVSSATARLSHCVADVATWFSVNRLRLNHLAGVKTAGRES